MRMAAGSGFMVLAFEEAGSIAMTSEGPDPYRLPTVRDTSRP
jgi:hypothetical protein